MDNAQISPQEVKQNIDNGDSFILLDVREQMEYQIAHLPHSVLIPLGELPARLGELDPEQEIVTLCHHGMRSQSALGILRQNGFTKVKNLSGGIDAYSQIVDSSIPRYK